MTVGKCEEKTMGEKFNAAVKTLLEAFLDELCESNDHDARLAIADRVMPPGYRIATPTEIEKLRQTGVLEMLAIRAPRGLEEK
jgi:hypothetical protein